MELSQISNVYFYDLQQYYRVLKQRNNLLKEIKVKPALADTLFVWDEQLIERGERIMAVRAKFLARPGKAGAEFRPGYLHRFHQRRPPQRRHPFSGQWQGCEAVRLPGTAADNGPFRKIGRN